MHNVIVLIAQLIVFICLVSVYLIGMPSYFSYTYIVVILIILGISLILFSIRKLPPSLKGNYLTSTFLFTLSFLIVHFQFYLDYALGLRQDLNLGMIYLNYDIVPKAISLAALSAIAFFIGSTFALLSPPKSRKFDIDFDVDIGNEIQSLRIIKLIMAFMLALYFYGTPLYYFQGGYNELMNNGSLSYIHYKSAHIFYLSIAAYIICMINMILKKKMKLNISQYLRIIGPTALTIIAIYLCSCLIAGNRRPLIAILTLLACGYYISQVKKLKLKNMAAIIIVAASALQVTSFLRLVDGHQSLSERIELAINNKAESANYTEPSILPFTTELATSLRAYHSTVMHMEENKGVFGLSTVGYLISIIPGLGLLVESMTSIKLTTSSLLITEWMGADHGMGTTVLADVYIDYGFIGSIIIFLLFGALLSRLDAVTYERYLNNNLLVQILALLYISNAVFLSRSSIMQVFADIVLIYVIIKISKILSPKRSVY